MKTVRILNEGSRRVISLLDELKWERILLVVCCFNGSFANFNNEVGLRRVSLRVYLGFKM